MSSTVRDLPRPGTLSRGAEFENSIRPVQVGRGQIRVLRLCSVKRRAAAQSENWVFSIAGTRWRKRNVLCIQFTVVFPSWTSRVRVPPPAQSPTIDCSYRKARKSVEFRLLNE